MSAGGGAATGSKWSCDTCTFENGGGNDYCDMCEMSRPGLLPGEDAFTCDLCSVDCTGNLWQDDAARPPARTALDWHGTHASPATDRAAPRATTCVPMAS